MKKMGILLLLAIIGSAGGAYAAGLSIPEQGAASMGLSAAVTARSQDLSSIFYNIAGIDYVEKNELFIGVTPIRPVHKLESDDVSKEATQKTYLPPQFYFAHRINPSTVFGFGVYSPFGLGTDWGQSWIGRYTSTYAEVQAVYITPGASVKLTDWLSVGAGLSVVYSSAVIEKMVDSGLKMYPQTQNDATIASTSYDSEFRLDGEGGGISWNAGVLLRPSNRVQFGVSYRARTDIDYEGEVEFTHQEDLAAVLNASMPSTQDGSTTLHLPSTLSAGVLYNLTERWDTSFDVNYVRWSSYDKLVITLDKELPAKQMTQAKDWDDTYTFRLGTSYDLSERTVLRGGLMYDQAPVPDNTFDAQLPDADRIGGSIGLGYQVGVVTLDFSYLFLKFADHDKKNFVGYSDVTKDGVVDAADENTLKALRGGAAYPVGSGTYKSYVNLLAVSASFKF